MTYSAFEYSSQSGAPVYRFLFSLGNNLYARTTEPVIVSDSNYTWTPSPIRVSEFSQTNELNKDPLKITLPRDDEFAALFVGGVPETITSVTVYRLHALDQDNEWRLYWKGRVTGIDNADDAVELECENIFSSMQRPGLRAKYTITCRHALYGRGCNLNDYDFAEVATVVSMSGRNLTLSTSPSDATLYNGGTLETSDGLVRYIRSQQDTAIELLSSLPSLEEAVNDSTGSAVVTLYPGCNHTTSDCSTVFNNIENFGGFPFMPSKNPFRNSVSGSIV